MKTRLLISAALLLVTGTLFGQQQPNALKLPTIDSVVEGLRENESQIETLSVTHRVKVTSAVPEFLLRRFNGGNLESRSNYQEQWQIKSSGAGWNQGEGQTMDTSVKGESTNHRLFWTSKG